MMQKGNTRCTLVNLFKVKNNKWLQKLEIYRLEKMEYLFYNQMVSETCDIHSNLVSTSTI